jgi:hypothetical protein
MLDIVSIPEDGRDLGFADTAVTKAANVVSTQLGSLEYAPDFGVDLKFFLQDKIQFQNASFRSYIVERLSQAEINVAQVTETVEAFVSKFTYSVGDAGDKMKGMII